MKKIIAAVCALLCLLTACSGAPEERENVGQITYAGVCLANADNAPYRDALEKELLRLGYYVNFLDAQSNQNTQHSQISQLMDEQYDVLIVEPVMAVAVEGILSRLKAADTPVVLVGKQPEDGVLAQWERACYVGFDRTMPGVIQAQIALNTANQGDVNGDGTVAYAILTGPKDYVDTAFHLQGCTDTMTRAEADSLHLDTVYAAHTTEQGKAMTEGLLGKYGRDIEVLFCGSDALALGALEALSASGRTVNTDIYVLGVGGAADVLSQVSQGTLTGTAMADPEALAKQAAAAAGQALTSTAQPLYLVDYTLKETP